VVGAHWWVFDGHGDRLGGEGEIRFLVSTVSGQAARQRGDWTERRTGATLGRDTRVWFRDPAPCPTLGRDRGTLPYLPTACSAEPLEISPLREIARTGRNVAHPFRTKGWSIVREDVSPGLEDDRRRISRVWP
jgi:hypothetical protein